jgi:hypothetical protein
MYYFKVLWAKVVYPYPGTVVCMLRALEIHLIEGTYDVFALFLLSNGLLLCRDFLTLFECDFRFEELCIILCCCLRWGVGAPSILYSELQPSIVLKRGIDVCH